MSTDYRFTFDVECADETHAENVANVLADTIADELDEPELMLDVVYFPLAGSDTAGRHRVSLVVELHPDIELERVDSLERHFASQARRISHGGDLHEQTVAAGELASPVLAAYATRERTTEGTPT